MKILLVLLTAWSVQGFAQTCSTVWVYQPFGTCRAAGSPDLSVNGQFVRYQELNSSKLEGAQDELGLCKALEEDFNGQQGNRAAGLVAVLTQAGPVRNVPHDENGITIHLKRTYYCGVNVYQHPVIKGSSAACGVAERYNYQVGGLIPQQDAQCLTCDSLDTGNIDDLSACLLANVKYLVNPRVVEFRDAELEAMKAKVRAVLKVNCANPLPTLQRLDHISLFMDLVGPFSCR